MEDLLDIEKFSESLDFESGKFVDIGNGMFLTNHEIRVLEQYQIPYKQCQSLKEILYQIESVLDEMDIVDEEVEAVSSSISERDYYQNTNW